MKIVNDRQEFLNSLDLKDKYCCEIGVFRGDFSKMILEKNPLYLYLVDPFDVGGKKYKSGLSTAYTTNEDYLLVKERFKYDHRVVIKRDYSYDLVKTIKDNYFDFLYLDASHLYDDVLQDLYQWYPKMKKDSWICGHDYIDNNDDFGVIEAVDKFCDLYNFEMFLFNQQGGDFALKRK